MASIGCSGALVNGVVVGYRVACVGARRANGSIGSLGSNGLVSCHSGLVKWLLGYDNTSKHIYLACFSLAIE